MSLNCIQQDLRETLANIKEGSTLPENDLEWRLNYLLSEHCIRIYSEEELTKALAELELLVNDRQKRYEERQRNLVKHSVSVKNTLIERRLRSYDQFLLSRAKNALTKAESRREELKKAAKTERGYVVITSNGEQMLRSFHAKEMRYAPPTIKSTE